MKTILYLICLVTLLMSAGCILVPVDDDRGGHWEHHDEGWHGGDHDDHR